MTRYLSDHVVFNGPSKFDITASRLTLMYSLDCLDDCSKGSPDRGSEHDAAQMTERDSESGDGGENKLQRNVYRDGGGKAIVTALAIATNMHGTCQALCRSVVAVQRSVMVIE
jgi:hypothetical protein